MTAPNKLTGANPSGTASTILEVGDRFEAQWRPEQSLDDLAAYLPPGDDPSHLQVLVELACRDLERRLQVGQAVRAEQYLERFPALGRESAAAVEVIATEFHQRRSRDEHLGPEEYWQRFPQMAAELAAHLQTGEPLVPGYTILGKVGSGGMGVVYRAQHLGLKRVVALKMILAGAHASDEDLVRFRAEAEPVARLQHPNIVQIYDVAELAGKPYFSMEFVDGTSLDRKIAQTPQPPEQAVALMEKVARAVQVAHQAGIIHRDLKPGNVLLGTDGTPKIVDFGLAKRLDADPGLTRTGVVMGTPSYMAPEQAAGSHKDQPVTASSDVYALGAIFYELLTGRAPFRAATPLDTLLQVVAEEPVLPRRLQPTVPRDLETICLKCLHKESARRYATAEALAEDLQRWLEGKPITARPVGVLERSWRWCRRKPAVAGLAAALLLVAFAGLGAAAWASYERIRSAEADSSAAEARANVLAEQKEKLAEQKEKAEAKAQVAEAKELLEKQRSEILRVETLPLIERANTLRAQGSRQVAALHQAKALLNNDELRYRALVMEDAQRSLVPVATSSRRILSSALLYSPDGSELVSADYTTGTLRV